MAIPEEDKRRILHDLCLPCKAAMIPVKSRFKAGDRVQMHGTPGHQFTGHNRPGSLEYIGFRGTLEGWIKPHLIGIADDGREWYERPGGLYRDGEPKHDRFISCTCCPDPVPEPVQGELFAMTSGEAA